MGTVTRMAVVLLATIGVQSQAHPNFSGTWAIVPSRSIWYDGSRPINITVFGERFRIEQTEQLLTVSIENEHGFKWVYRLDGDVSRNMPPGPAGPSEASSRIAWNDAELIITTTLLVGRDGRSQPGETRRSLTFNDDGTLRVAAPWGSNGAMIASVYSKVP